MDNTNREIIKLYDRVSEMQKDFAESVKEIYNTISDSLDKIDVPANVSELVNDLKYTTESAVDEKINNIEFDDSNFLKKEGEQKQKSSIPTTFKELHAQTKDSDSSDDNVATTEFVHKLVESSSSATLQYLVSMYNKGITLELVNQIVQNRISDVSKDLTKLVNDEIDIALENINTTIDNINIPTSLSQLANDSGFITLLDVPDDLVTSVNGQTGAVSISIPTTLSLLTNDSGYITDAGVTSVNNQTGSVSIQENVQADWSATSGLAKILNKPALKRVATTADYEDLENTPTIPTKISDLVDDIGILTSYTEIDPTVPQWARQSTKPTYTAQEVGAATISDLETAIANIVNQAPATLDTLNELASALGNDPNFATTIANQIGDKYTKPSTGIPASDLADGVIPSAATTTADGLMSSEDKTKLNGIESGAQVHIAPTNTEVINAIGYTPYNATNPNGYTSNTGTVTGVTVGTVPYTPTSGVVTIPSYPTTLPASDVSAWAKESSKPIYIASEVMSISTVAIMANTSSSCSITKAGNAGKAQTIIYVNNSSSDFTVTVPTTYKTPDGAAIELTCKAGGYCEVSYLNIGGTIYARGL